MSTKLILDDDPRTEKTFSVARGSVSDTLTTGGVRDPSCLRGVAACAPGSKDDASIMRNENDDVIRCGGVFRLREGTTEVACGSPVGKDM